MTDPITYTAAECAAEIAEIRAEMKRVRKVASSWSIGDKAFDFKGKMAELQAQEALWMERWQIASGNSTSSLQGPALSLRPRSSWS